MAQPVEVTPDDLTEWLTAMVEHGDRKNDREMAQRVLDELVQLREKVATPTSLLPRDEAAGGVVRKPWPRDPRYLVGDDGTVIGPRGPVSGVVSPDGYIQVSYRRPDGTRTTTTVNVMVCETFHGPRPGRKYQAAHWDGNPSNNVLSNLRWATPSQNARDSIRHGTFGPTRPERTGESHHLAVLTEELVREIRGAYDGKHGAYTRLAQRYGVHPDTIKQVVTRVTWKHVE
jgi:hypothetical protein